MDDHGWLDNQLIELAVKAVQRTSLVTLGGEGNFNFTVNFNCAALIPYFPASFHNGQLGNCFVIDLQTPDLLVEVLKQDNQSHSKSPHSRLFNGYYAAMSKELQQHIDNIGVIVRRSKHVSGFTFASYDSSAAPSKDCASMVELYQQMGVEYFGAASTVEASALLTRVFKSISGVNLVGFFGLMLALTEATGLAQGSINNEFDIRSLLTYSAVCGIGLDTEPIPGNTPAYKIVALMRHTGTMAFRLNKPLTVRLFSVPNLSAGALTAFTSPSVCNCALLAVP